MTLILGGRCYCGRNSNHTIRSWVVLMVVHFAEFLIYSDLGSARRAVRCVAVPFALLLGSSLKICVVIVVGTFRTWGH